MIDIPLVYNVIIRHPILKALWVVTSTYHLAMKFPTIAGVGIIQGNQVEVCKCYTLAMKENESNPKKPMS